MLQRNQVFVNLPMRMEAARCPATRVMLSSTIHDAIESSLSASTGRQALIEVPILLARLTSMRTQVQTIVSAPWAKSTPQRRWHDDRDASASLRSPLIVKCWLISAGEATSAWSSTARLRSHHSIPRESLQTFVEQTSTRVGPRGVAGLREPSHASLRRYASPP